MPTPEQLQEENERLKAENEAYRAAATKKEAGFLQKTILNITAPTILKGVALGIAISILVYKIVTVEAGIFVLQIILAAGALLAIGFFLGQWAVKKTQKQATEAWDNAVANSDGKTALFISKIAQVITGKAVSPKHVEELSNATEQYKPLLVSGRNWVIAVVLRVMAFSSLMGVLAIAVSFAVAIATFQQVELLKVQNDKLEIQNNLLEEQDSLLVEQNDLFNQQNTKVDTQTSLMGRQTKQLDIQNEYIKQQITQADIQNKLVEKQNTKIDHQNKRLDQQTNLQEASRRSSLVFLFSNIMDAIDRELRDSTNKERKLSKPLIGRIIALSASLKPYRYLTEGDTLTTKLLSPERGQLLINLVESDLDSVTYLEIFEKANFECADLEGGDLRTANLIKANLRKASLIDANLSDANLVDARLMYANLQDVKLSGAKLMYANLSYANLQDADLRLADLRDVDLIDANLKDADLRLVKVTSLNFLVELNQETKGSKEVQKKYYVYPTLNKNKHGEYYQIKRKIKQK